MLDLLNNYTLPAYVHNNSIMKYFVILCLLACSYFGYGQDNEKNEFKIYNTYQDYTNKEYNVKEYIIRNDSVFSLDTNEVDFNYKNIWGIVYENSLYRIFDDEVLKVEDTSGLIVYTLTFLKDHLQAKPTWIPLNIEGSGWPGWFPVSIYESETSTRKDYYFSLSLESEIFELSKKEVLKQVNNKAFEKALKKKFGWLTSIYKYDDKNNIFLINQVYKSVFEN